MERTIETHLSKIVEAWQLSQPLHLRHLSIVRDTGLIGNRAHYVHYSFENFKSLVDSGEKAWEAVSTVAVIDRKNESIAPLHAQPDLDEYGFPRLQHSLFHGRYNDATLSECVELADKENLILSQADPLAFKLDNNTWGKFSCRR